MILHRPSDARGQADFGWLKARHSFSFGRYVDRDHMGFRALRVINEDRVAGGGGFSPHDHNDMEIMTLILDGALQHRDSMGNGAVIRPGEVQVMSAGTGVTHSEFNASATEPVHLLQMWVLPDRAGHAPRYDQRNFAPHERRNRFRTAVAGFGEAAALDALAVHQDMRLNIAEFDAGAKASYALRPGRFAWVQVHTGTGTINGVEVAAGDGVAIAAEDAIHVSAKDALGLVAFDLA